MPQLPGHFLVLIHRLANGEARLKPGVTPTGAPGDAIFGHMRAIASGFVVTPAIAVVE